MNGETNGSVVNPRFVSMAADAAKTAGFVLNGQTLQGEKHVAELRRAGRRLVSDPIEIVTLTQREGMLEWDRGGIGMPLPGARRAGGVRQGISGQVVQQFKFERLEPNKIGEYLSDLDQKLTPQRGLRRRVAGQLQPVNGVDPNAKRIVLFIHGTFSKSDVFFEHFLSTPAGKNFLDELEARYDGIYTFDHPTLSVSPMLNGLDLARLLDTDAEIHVICHSRGGLVCRWWLEVFNTKPARKVSVVMVGSPLTGTSLAAAPKLRHALDFLTNIGHVLESVAGMTTVALPLMSVVYGILRVMTSIGGVASHTPLVDAAIAMIPGLQGQALVVNNEELLRLNSRANAANVRYSAVQSSFEPLDPQWRFWRYFVKGTDHLAASLAKTVFEQENDLVVDTASMVNFGNFPIAQENIWSFGRSPSVHHLNYFVQPETSAFIKKALPVDQPKAG